MLISLIWGITIGLAGFVVLLALIWLVSKRPIVGLYLLSIPLLALWEYPNSLLVASVLGSQIYLLDVLSIVFICSAPLIIEKRRGSPIITTLWVALFAIFAFSVCWGLTVYGTSAPIVEARQQLSFFAPAVWCALVDWAPLKRSILRWMYATGWTLIAVSVFHAAQYGIGDASSFVESATGEQVGRVLVSVQALALMLFAWFSAVHGQMRRRWFFVAACAAAVVLSQQRTVWVVAIVVFSISLLVSQRRARTMTVVGLAGTVLALVTLTGAFSSLDFLAESAGNDSTYVARSYSWGQLINQAVDNGAQTVLTGAPYGSGFIRLEMNGQIATFNPHNWYLTLFLRLGAIGLALFLAAIFFTLATQLRNRQWTWAIAGTAGLLVYGWTYNLPFIAAPLLGMFLSVAVGKDAPDAHGRNEEDRHIAYAQ